MVEIANENGQFIFKYDKSNFPYGKCENCYNYNFLRVMCACKKVSYCNKEC